MATALRLDDGRHELELEDGTRLRTALPADRLQALGYDIREPERAAMTAYNDQPGASDSRSDVPAEVPGARGADLDVVGGRIPALERRPAPASSASPVATVYGVNASGDLVPESGEPTRETAAPDVAPRGVTVGPDGGYVKGGAPGDKVGRFGAKVESVEALPPRTSAAPIAARPTLARANQSKGTDIRTGFTKQTSAAAGLLPESEEAESDARIQRKLAEQQLGDVKAEQYGNEMGMASQEERYRRAQQAQYERQQAQMQAAKADYESRQAQLTKDADAVDKLEVDPNRYFSKMGTAGRILAAIGMIAGGINAGLRGGPNQPAEFIHRAIQDDIDDQKQRIALRRQGIATRQTQLDKTAALLHGDMDLAEKQVEANHQALAAALVKKYAAETGAKNISPQLLAFGAQLDQEATEKRLQNAAQFGDKMAEQYQWIPDRYVGGAPAVKESDVHEVAKDLQSAGVPDLEASVGSLQDLLDKLPPDGSVPTNDTRNFVSRGVRAAADYVGGTGSGAALLDTPDERSSAAALERVKGQVRHTLSGVSTNPTEQKSINDELDQINTPQGLRSYTQEKVRDLKRRWASSVAGNKPEAVRVYEGRHRAYDLPRRPDGLRGEQ
jgi:hypothetical protein